MENLICVPVEHEGEFLWCVFERATDQVINSFYFEEEAHEYIGFINKGGAFAGFTPKFILTEFKTKGDINDSFNFEL